MCDHLIVSLFHFIHLLFIRISALTWTFSLSHCHIFPILQHELQNYLRTIDWSFLSLRCQKCSMLYVGFTKQITRNDMFTVFTYECSTVLPLTDLFHIHNFVFCNIHTLHFSTTFLFSFDWFLFPELSCEWREDSFPFVPLQPLLKTFMQRSDYLLSPLRPVAEKSLRDCDRCFGQFRYTNTGLPSLPRLFKWGLIGIEEI